MTKKNSKLNQLVSIRGIAAWWVVLFHSQALMDGMPPILLKIIGHGYLAVDLFFILSGFIIFINYYEKVSINSLNSIGVFYWHRFTRIYPVHFLMLMAYLLLAISFFYFSSSGMPPESYTGKAFFDSILLIQAWSDSAMSWNVPSWSISAEWFVYLLFPFVAIALRKLTQGLGGHFLVSIIVLTVLMYAYSDKHLVSLGNEVASMALTRALLEFIIGTIIGSLYVKHNEFLVKNQKYLAIGSVLIFLGYVFNDIKDYVLIPAGFFLLIAYLSVARSYLNTVLSNKLLVYLGEISYSTYMVHYFVYDVLKAGWVNSTGQVNQLYLFLSFVAVLLLSIGLHHVFEKPMQRYLRLKFSNYKLKPG